MQRIGVVLGAVAVTGLLAGCATNPVTGKSQFSLVSSAQELQIGRDGYTAVVQQYGVYADPRVAAYVDSVGQRVAHVSHEPGLAWHFTVLDDPEVNAFAMPGGYIYVTRGILTHLNSEAQLAGVLGHEEGHVTARHTAQQLTQQQIASLGLGVAGMVAPVIQQYGGAAQQALGLLFLRFSRAHETQADDLGVAYTAKANYDPNEIPNTYAMLGRVMRASGSTLPTFLSTHPDPGNREQRTGEEARAASAGRTGLVVRSRDYIRHLDGMVYGNDPRQGYFEGTRFVQPEMGFEITFPSGWQTQNSRSTVVAAAPNQGGAMQLTLADAKGRAPGDFVTALLQGQQLASADGASETLSGDRAWIGRIGVLGTDGTTTPMTAAFVEHGAGTMLQILGSAVGGDAVVLGAIRSFHRVDPARVTALPSRMKIVTVPHSGTFSSVVASFGPQAIDVNELAIVNNVEVDETVAEGTLLKLVPKPGR